MKDYEIGLKISHHCLLLNLVNKKCVLMENRK
jgi:hypothetical protein